MTRRATLRRVGEAARDPSGRGRGCTSPCTTREVGSLWQRRVGVSGQHATPADWGREKERGSATVVGREGSGKQRATPAAEGRVASVVGGAGQREGVGVGRETVAMVHSACSPTRLAPDLEKKTVLSLCKSNYIINIYISLLIDKSMKISLIAVM